MQRAQESLVPAQQSHRAATEADTADTVVIGPSVVDDRTVAQVLDLALRIGERTLAGGAAAADVSATMLAVADAYALPRCEVDVTFNSIVVSCHRGREAPPVTTARVVRSRSLDYTRLAGLDRLAKRIARGQLTVTEAAAELDALVSGDRTYPRWVRTAAFGGMAASLAVLIGGGLLALVAAAVTALVDRVGRALNQRGLPPFFQQVAGAGVVTASAIVLYKLLPEASELRPSVVVGAGLTVLLSGLSFVGTVQDAITGFYVTAAARAFEVLLLTTGLVAGIAMLLQIGDAVGISVDVTPSEPPGPLPWRRTAEVAAAAATAAFFALASYAPLRAMIGAAAAGGTSWLAYALILEAGLGRTAAAALAAVLLGLVGQMVARRLRLPPLVMGVSGIVPLLPGMTTYLALQELIFKDDDPTQGLAQLLVAASIALSLAAGVVLGEFLAQPLRRRLGRLERRLAGPRLIGPLRPSRRRLD